MGFHTLDLIIILAYLAGITLFGVSFRRRQHDLKDYFLGGRTTPWWAISLSIVAAETSILTIISTPGMAYSTDLAFLQLVLGYLVARVAISLLLLPHYFRGEIFTAYELMQRRFGGRVKALSSLIFLVGRALAEGVRVFAISIVLGVVLESLRGLGWRLHLNEMQIIGIIAVLTFVYTFEGGLKAVIWTDFIQICIYVAGAVLSFVYLVRVEPGGWAAIAALARAHGDKLRIFHFGFSWYKPYTFWSGLLGGTFLTLATDGTDQLIVQRLLSARSERESRWALLSSWVVICFQFVLFLLIGVALFAFYRTHPLPPAGGIGKFDRIYPEFIVTYLPTGVVGVLIAAIIAAAMSNLSAALNALSSATIIDFYRPHLRPNRSEKHYLWAARVATGGWTVVLALIAYASRHSHSVLQAGLTIVSFPFAGLLGIFLLGTLTKRANGRGAFIGLAVGVALAVGLYKLGLPFTWFIVFGTLTTFAVGYAVSWTWPEAAAVPQP